MWLPKLLPPPVNFFLAQTRPNFAQNMFSWTQIGLCRLIWCPVGWLVGGCGARAVSCKIPIYFIIDRLKIYEVPYSAALQL